MQAQVSLKNMYDKVDLRINTNEIHLWYVLLNQITDINLLAYYKTLLSPTEHLQMEKIVFESDKKRFLVTRALVRTTLSRYSLIRPEDWIFTITDYGKPIINNTDLEQNFLSFNLSHTHDLVLLGLIRNWAIGVDVENILTKVEHVDIAKEYFTSEEIDSLQKLSKDKQVEKFFKYWTLKESYLKAKGYGLSIPLNSISFHLRAGAGIRYLINSPLEDSGSLWKFWQFQPTVNHIASVCVENYSETTKVILKEIIPLVEEKERKHITFVTS